MAIPQFWPEPRSGSLMRRRDRAHPGECLQHRQGLEHRSGAARRSTVVWATWHRRSTTATRFESGIESHADWRRCESAGPRRRPAAPPARSGRRPRPLRAGRRARRHHQCAWWPAARADRRATWRFPEQSQSATAASRANPIAAQNTVQSSAALSASAPSGSERSSRSNPHGRERRPRRPGSRADQAEIRRAVAGRAAGAPPPERRAPPVPSLARPVVRASALRR